MRFLPLFFLGFCLYLFTASATTDLALPGPQDDEMVHAVLAIDMMRPPYPFGEYTLHVGSQPLPFGVDPHTGALKAYLLWPLFALFGPSVELLRFFTIGLGLLTLLFFYLFSKELFGFWSAFWGLLLLSLDSSFIFYSKLDAGPIVEQLLWMMIGLWSFLQGKKSEKRIFMLVGLSSIPLGLYSSISFTWVVLAFTFAVGIIAPEELKKFFSRKNIPWIFFFAFISLVIFLYWLIGQYRHSPYFQIAGIRDVFAMFRRLSTQAGIIPDILIGHWFEDPKLVHFNTRPLTDLLFLCTVLFLLRFFCTKRVKLLLFCLAVGFILMTLTPENLGIYPHRMMVFYIFLPLLSGVALSVSLSALSSIKNHSLTKGIASISIVLLFVVSLTGQTLLTREVIQEVRKIGGRGFWADAIYSLADYLKREKWDRVICLSWELKRPLFLVTKGSLPLEEIYEIEEFRKDLRRGKNLRTCFLLHSPEYFWIGISIEEFKKVIRERGERPILEGPFRQRDGKSVYLVYRMQSSS